MSDKVSLVRVLTAATGNSTPITLGARYSDLFMTPADAGAVDGRTYTWLIVDGNNWELVKGVYTASGTTAARTTVLASRSAGTLGTSRIVLSGTAQVRIIESAVDMDGVRGTRSVAGTSDTLASTDLGYVVTYGNAGAVAVSLAQAGTASLYDGWATWVQNTGVGTVTITPMTSTINGNATLPLATNMGAFIWSDGTNYHAYFVPVSKPLLAANNLADVANAATALGNLNGVSYGAAQSLTTAQQAQAQSNIGAVPDCGQLQFSRHTALKLMPFHGDLLKIAGAIYKIPSAGLASGLPTSCFLNGTAAQTLAVNTLYYVYAFTNSGALALDFSTTGHATDTTAGNIGVEIKSGDPSRSLVGMIQTGATVIFVNSATQRFVRSWLNSFSVDIGGASTNATTTSGTLVEVSTGARVNFLVWSGEVADICCQGTMTDSTGANSEAAAVGIDGATTTSQEVAANNYVAGARCAFNSRFVSSSLSEGFHFATPLLRSIGGGTAGFTDVGAQAIGRVGR